MRLVNDTTPRCRLDSNPRPLGNESMNHAAPLGRFGELYLKIVLRFGELYLKIVE